MGNRGIKAGKEKKEMIWDPQIEKLPYLHTTAIINDISCLYPPFRDKVMLVQQKAKEQGLPHRVFETYRSDERQAIVYPGHHLNINVHHVLIATDFVPYVEPHGWTWDRPQQEWEAFGALVESLGLTWGGRWRSIIDCPHIQGVSVADQADLLKHIYPDYEGQITSQILSARQRIVNDLANIYSFSSASQLSSATLSLLNQFRGSSELKNIAPERD
jgi:hypothetical protein